MRKNYNLLLLLFIFTVILAFSPIAKAEAPYDCFFPCDKFGVDWQHPQEQANCMRVCKICLSEEVGGQIYWCRDDSRPNCTCLK